jgi:hypothetical protein
LQHDPVVKEAFLESLQFLLPVHWTEFKLQEHGAAFCQALPVIGVDKLGA